MDPVAKSLMLGFEETLLMMPSPLRSPLLRRCKARAATLLVILVAAPTAHGLTINFNGALGASADAALSRAALQWTSRISDPVTVNIDVKFENLPGGILGQASSVLLTTTDGGYDIVRSALIADSSAESDDAIVASLPTAAQFSFSMLPAGITVDPELLGSKANFKALGFQGLDIAIGPKDGEIQFNQVFPFDFDNSNGVTGTDFETVAAHDIGHILGFQSVVDIFNQGFAGNIGVFMLDLFRLGMPSAPTTPAAFTTTQRELNPGNEAVFGDTDDNYRLSTGSNMGDGRQASHFKDDSLLGTHLGIMDPTLTSNVFSDVTEADLRVLDLIGWDVTPIPLPPAVMLFGSACGVFGLLRPGRTRRNSYATYNGARPI